MIITCSPSIHSEKETIETLKFGMKLRKIRNKPRINREFTIAELQIVLAQLNDQVKQKDLNILELQGLLLRNKISLPDFEQEKAKKKKSDPLKTSISNDSSDILEVFI